MFKAVAVDLDGTLLNDEKNISKTNLEALKLAKNKNCEIIIATGRSYSAVENLLHLFDYPITVISYNGAKVTRIEDKKVLFEKSLSENIVKELIKLSHKYKVHLNLYQNEIWYVENINNSETKSYKKKSKINPVEKNFLTFENLQMTKALFIAKNEKLKEIKKELGENLEEEAYIAFSQQTYLEVLNKECNKKNALEFVLENMGIKLEECIAFGDAENDVEMISSVGCGVAMENAMDSIKNIAKHVTKDNNKHGVGDFLINFFNK